MWISTNVTNIYLMSIRFRTLHIFVIQCIKASVYQRYWGSYLKLQFAPLSLEFSSSVV
jgi:hypothetical protein